MPAPTGPNLDLHLIVADNLLSKDVVYGERPGFPIIHSGEHGLALTTQYVVKFTDAMLFQRMLMGAANMQGTGGTLQRSLPHQYPGILNIDLFTAGIDLFCLKATLKSQQNAIATTDLVAKGNKYDYMLVDCEYGTPDYNIGTNPGVDSNAGWTDLSNDYKTAYFTTIVPEFGGQDIMIEGQAFEFKDRFTVVGGVITPIVGGPVKPYTKQVPYPIQHGHLRCHRKWVPHSMASIYEPLIGFVNDRAMLNRAVQTLRLMGGKEVQVNMPSGGIGYDVNLVFAVKPQGQNIFPCCDPKTPINQFGTLVSAADHVTPIYGPADLRPLFS